MNTSARVLAFPGFVLTLLAYLVASSIRVHGLLFGRGAMLLQREWGKWWALILIISVFCLIALLILIIGIITISELSRRGTGETAVKACAAFTFVLGFVFVFWIGTGSLATLALPALVACEALNVGQASLGVGCVFGGALVVAGVAACALAGVANQILSSRYRWSTATSQRTLVILCALALASAPWVLVL